MEEVRRDPDIPWNAEKAVGLVTEYSISRAKKGYRWGGRGGVRVVDGSDVRLGTNATRPDDLTTLILCTYYLQNT